MAAVLPVVKPANPKGVATERNGMKTNRYLIVRIRKTVIPTGVEFKTLKAARAYCDASGSGGLSVLRIPLANQYGPIKL